MRNKPFLQDRSWRAIGALLLACLSCSRASADETEPAARQPLAILHLARDVYAAGELRASDDPRTLRWQSPHFTRPFDFSFQAVHSVHFPLRPAASAQAGEFRVELVDGDVLFGSPVRVTADEVELETPRFGRLRVRRAAIRGLVRRNVEELVYQGPNGLAGWQEIGATQEWTEEAGQLVTLGHTATIFSNVGIPPRAAIEFELSWRSQPDFCLSLGVDEKVIGTNAAYRFEVLSQALATPPILLADARQGDQQQWNYTFDDPGQQWFEADYQPKDWKVGPAGFGVQGTPGAIVRTEWNTPTIWLRRQFDLPEIPKGISLTVHHDDYVQVWINGQFAYAQDGHISGYSVAPVSRSTSLLRQGKNVIAVHCRKGETGQYVDVGILDQPSSTAGDLVAVRETNLAADMVSVQTLDFAAASRTRLVAYLDQITGRMLVLAADGTTLADMTVAPGDAQPLAGLALMNRGADLRLERLRISHWDGIPPVGVLTTTPRLVRVDGTSVDGQLASLDAETGQFIVNDGPQATRVDAAQVASVFLGGDERAPIGEQRGMRALCQDGTLLSGDFSRIVDDRLHLACPSILSDVGLPTADLRSLVILRQADQAAPPLADGPAGLLEMDGLRLPGRLTSGQEGPEASCLAWQPDFSTTDSPLRPGATGRITYSQSTSAAPTKPEQPATALSYIVQLAARRLARFAAAFADSGQAATPWRATLHLRTGDIFACELTAINEEGVYFRAANSDATFVPHAMVKAAVFTPTNVPPRLNKSKRNRLLMLPRAQTDSPPTHLLRSTEGDFLRARLLAMDGVMLRVEVQLQEKLIPRDRVSHLIWLHTDELDTTVGPKTGPPPASNGTRVQARVVGGERFTFDPRQLTATELAGNSGLIGSCRVELARVEKLLIGDAIEQDVADWPYTIWRLHRAIQPKFVQNPSGQNPASQPAETDAGLVGKPAPEVDLNLLDGRTFRLSEQKGRVVVLDFWATWCGPCLQTMPEIDRVVHEFEGRNVDLVAVNLEEPASIITATLERTKLQLTVALDRDGVVAARYKTTAIPQTVVIDPEGNVARVIVGGGRKAVEQLRQSLRELFPDPLELTPLKGPDN